MIAHIPLAPTIHYFGIRKMLQEAHPILESFWRLVYTWGVDESTAATDTLRAGLDRALVEKTLRQINIPTIDTFQLILVLKTSPFLPLFLKTFHPSTCISTFLTTLSTLHTAHNILLHYWSNHQSIQHAHLLHHVTAIVTVIAQTLREIKSHNTRIPTNCHPHVTALLPAIPFLPRLANYPTLPISLYTAAFKSDPGVLLMDDCDAMYLRWLDVCYTLATNMTKGLVEVLKAAFSDDESKEYTDECVAIRQKRVHYRPSYYPENLNYPLPKWLFNILPKSPAGDMVDMLVLDTCDTGDYVGQAVPAYWTAEWMIRAVREFHLRMGVRHKLDEEVASVHKVMVQKCDVVLKVAKSDVTGANTWWDYYEGINKVQELFSYWPEMGERVKATIERFDVIKEAYIFCPVPLYYKEVDEICLPRARATDDGGRTILEDGGRITVLHPGTDHGFVTYREFVMGTGLEGRTLNREWLVEAVWGAVEGGGGVTVLTVGSNACGDCGFGVRQFTTELSRPNKEAWGAVVSSFVCDEGVLGGPGYGNSAGVYLHRLHQILGEKVPGYKRTAARYKRLKGLGFNPMETYGNALEIGEILAEVLEEFAEQVEEGSDAGDELQKFVLVIGTVDKASKTLKTVVGRLVGRIQCNPKITRWLRVILSSYVPLTTLEEFSHVTPNVVTITDAQYAPQLLGDVRTYCGGAFGHENGRLTTAIDEAKIEGLTAAILADKITTSSKGNLNYAVTVIDFVEMIALNRRDLDTRREMFKVVNLLDDEGFEQGTTMDRVYGFFVSNYLSEYWMSLYKAILQVIMCAYEPLEDREIFDAIMCEMPEETFPRGNSLNDMCEAMGKITWRDFSAALNSLGPFIRNDGLKGVRIAAWSFRRWLVSVKINPEYNVLPLARGHEILSFAHDHYCRFSRPNRVAFNVVGLLMHNSLRDGNTRDDCIKHYTVTRAKDGTCTHTRVFNEVFKSSMTIKPCRNMQAAIVMAFFIMKEGGEDKTRGTIDLATIVAGLIQAGTAINRELLEDYDSSLAHLCCAGGDVEALRECIPSGGAGWEGNVEMAKGMIGCLQICCDGGQAECLRELLKECPKKLEINKGAEEEEGVTPLHRACRGGYVECVEVLLEHPNKFKTTGILTGRGGGLTALYLACKYGHVACVDVLLRQKDCLNVVNLFDKEEEMNPLAAAVEGGHCECVTLLLGNGADVGAKNGKGETALMRAERLLVECKEGKLDLEECVEILEEAVELGGGGGGGGKKKGGGKKGKGKKKKK